MSIRYENVKYYSGAVGGAQPSEQVPGFADGAYYDTNKSLIAGENSTNTVMTQGTLRSSPTGSKQDLQANSQGGLKNVLGAVGQGLVPMASTFLGSALAGTGALTQGLLSNFAPALAGGTPFAAKAGPFFPTPPVVGQATFNSDGTVDATNLNGYPQGSG
jgi:hypothetical protein